MRQPDVGLVTVNERDSGDEVVHGCFPEAGDSILSIFFFGALLSEAVRQLSSFSG